MARSWLSGLEARILNDLARDLSLVAQRLNSITAHEDRIKKLYSKKIQKRPKLSLLLKGSIGNFIYLFIEKTRH